MSSGISPVIWCESTTPDVPGRCRPRLLESCTFCRPSPGRAADRLASQIGSGLTGVVYVLDEPAIGLHADNNRLLGALRHLRDWATRWSSSTIARSSRRPTISSTSGPARARAGYAAGPPPRSRHRRILTNVSQAVRPRSRADQPPPARGGAGDRRRDQGRAITTSGTWIFASSASSLP
jgi:hypothetical protein